MKLIRKSPPPGWFVAYGYETHAYFNGMSKKQKDNLKGALLDEQGWVCGYCQQRIINREKSSIEHYCEQSICNGSNNTPDLRLDYTNLMAVCPGKHIGNVFHCDELKGRFGPDNGLPISVSPWNQAHMDAMSYNTAGSITTSMANHQGEIDRILNLNANFLVELRRQKIKSFYKYALRNGSIDRPKLRRRLLSEAQRQGNKYNHNFPGVAEYLLKKYAL